MRCLIPLPYSAAIRLRCAHLIAMLRAMYTGTQVSIKGTISCFETLVGCRKAALEPPPIFNIYMDLAEKL